MRFTSVLLFISSVVLLSSVGSGFSSEIKADGEIRNGYRILTLQNTSEFQGFQVYRGDYIKFRLPEQFDKTEIVFPGLNERKTLINDLETSEYIKMKKTGEFLFEAGRLKGSVTVIEYRQSSYNTATAKEALDFIRQKRPLILDARTPGEYKAGHLEKAVLIPVQVLQSNLNRLDDYKDKPVLVYCATGNRSTVASKIMIDSGFKQILNLRQGIVDWHKRGFPVVR